MIEQKVVHCTSLVHVSTMATTGPLQRRLLDTPAFDQLTEESLSRLALAPSLQQKERLHIVEAYFVEADMTFLKTLVRGMKLMQIKHYFVQ